MTVGKITCSTGIDYCSSVSRYVRKSYSKILQLIRSYFTYFTTDALIY